MNKAGAQKEESTQLGLALMNADYRSYRGYTDQSYGPNRVFVVLEK